VWNRDHRSPRDVSSPARGDAAPTPGKRTLTMDLDARAAPIQRKAGSDAPDATPASPSPTSGGDAMPADVRSKMERAFGADFSGVRIHQGHEAQSIGALGYTQGNTIHFAPGQYDPHSERGQELLGHELTHVVQQSQGRVQAPGQAKGLAVNDDPGLEHEADDLGARAARGEIVGNARATATPAPGGPLQMSKSETIQRIVVALGVTTTVAATIYMALPASVALLLATGGLAGIGEYWSGVVNGVISRFLGTRATPQGGSSGSTTQPPPGSDTPSKELVVESVTKSTEEGGSSHEHGKDHDKTQDSKEESEKRSLIEGKLGDCLYTAVNHARGNAGDNEDAFRQIATMWLLAQQDDHPIFQFGDRAELIQVVSTPGAWTGDEGDLSAVVLAHSLGLRLRVVTAANVYVFDGGGGTVTIYYNANHYTSFPVEGVHGEEGGEIVAKPKKSKQRKPEKTGEVENTPVLDSAPPKLDTPSGGTKSDPSPSPSTQRAPSTELPAGLAQTYRNLMRALGAQVPLSDLDRRIMAILRQALAEDQISPGDRNTVEKYLQSGGITKGSYSGSKTDAPSSTPRTYQGSEVLEDDTTIDYDALTAVMEGVTLGVQVGPSVWRQMRDDLSKAIKLPNKSHKAHGSNFNAPQRPEQQIADWLKPFLGALREALVGYFLTIWKLDLR
jgi:Domain of unknown function (DUF4157)